MSDRVPTFEERSLPLLDGLYAFARFLSRDPAVAEDLVQETYLKALRGFSSFQEGTNFRAWMFRILRNTFLSDLEKAKRFEPLAEDEDAAPPAPSDEGPEGILLTRLRAEEVTRALEALPSGSREILLLREVEELSYAEIAGVLDVPVGTVMSRLFRARGALRVELTRKETP